MQVSGWVGRGPHGRQGHQLENSGGGLGLDGKVRQCKVLCELINERMTGYMSERINKRCETTFFRLQQ